MDWRQRTIEVAQQYGIDPGIAVAQIQAESSFNPSASSGVAHGLAQFTPATWRAYGGGGGDIWNGEDSLKAWGRYMSHLLSVFGGDYRLALAGYHSGEGDARAALNNPAGNPKTNAYVNKIMGSAGSVTVSDDGANTAIDLSMFDDDNSLLYFVAAGILVLYLLS